MAKLRLVDKGIAYLHMCPGCDMNHIIWVKPQHIAGPVWTFNNDLDKPTFAPSVRIRWGGIDKQCHYHIKKGKIIYCKDCSHSLAGKTVDLPELV